MELLFWSFKQGACVFISHRVPQITDLVLLMGWALAGERDEGGGLDQGRSLIQRQQNPEPAPQAPFSGQSLPRCPRWGWVRGWPLHRVPGRQQSSCPGKTALPSQGSVPWAEWAPWAVGDPWAVVSTQQCSSSCLRPWLKPQQWIWAHVCPPSWAAPGCVACAVPRGPPLRGPPNLKSLRLALLFHCLCLEVLIMFQRRALPSHFAWGLQTVWPLLASSKTPGGVGAWERISQKCWHLEAKQQPPSKDKILSLHKEDERDEKREAKALTYLCA